MCLSGSCKVQYEQLTAETTKGAACDGEDDDNDDGV